MTAEVVDRQERRKRRTRQAIQKAAFELFAERGYRGTTINDIAQRAEVAPRTVTVHFPAKEELFLDAEPFTLDSLCERLSARRPNESALEALCDWLAITMTEAETSGSEIDGGFPALATVAGLRELFESGEAHTLAAPPSAAKLLE